MTIVWRMCIACQITKITVNTLRICNTYCFFLWQQWLYECALMLSLYVQYIASLVSYPNVSYGNLLGKLPVA